MIVSQLLTMSAQPIIYMLIGFALIMLLELLAGVITCIIAFVKMISNKKLGVPQPKSKAKQL